MTALSRIVNRSPNPAKTGLRQQTIRRQLGLEPVSAQKHFRLRETESWPPETRDVVLRRFELADSGCGKAEIKLWRSAVDDVRILLSEVLFSY
jgi:hypothetical protein